MNINVGVSFRGFFKQIIHDSKLVIVPKTRNKQAKHAKNFLAMSTV